MTTTGHNADPEQPDAAEQLPQTSSKRGERRARRPGRTEAGVAGLPTGNGPTDGLATRIVLSDRQDRVASLSRDGWSLRAIARRVGCSQTTVHADLQTIAEAARAGFQRSVDDWRHTINERLDDSRRRLLPVARGESLARPPTRAAVRAAKAAGLPAPASTYVAPTVAEQLAAERLLARVEEQRATLVGANAQKGVLGSLGDALDKLLSADTPDDLDDVASLTYDTTAMRPALPPPQPIPQGGRAAFMLQQQAITQQGQQRSPSPTASSPRQNRPKAQASPTHKREVE